MEVHTADATFVTTIVLRLKKKYTQVVGWGNSIMVVQKAFRLQAPRINLCISINQRVSSALVFLCLLILFIKIK